MSPRSIPKIKQVLELCLYARSLARSVEFYADVLDLGRPTFASDRLAVFPLGETTLILFQRGETDQASTLPGDAGVIPGHGVAPALDGVDLRTHFALAVDRREDVDAWEARFEQRRVDVLGKVDWPSGGKSVYFKDVDGHVGEIASRGIWPHY
ncbi:hypothetical protein JCM11491_005601 [Sporobolomyces phaffii]